MTNSQTNEVALFMEGLGEWGFLTLSGLVLLWDWGKQTREMASWFISYGS